MFLSFFFFFLTSFPPSFLPSFLLQVSFYAYILGTLFSYVVKKDEKAEAYRKSMTALDYFCKNHKLPAALTERCTKYVTFQLKNSKQDDNADIVHNLPLSLLSKVSIVTICDCFFLCLFLL